MSFLIKTVKEKVFQEEINIRKICLDENKLFNSKSINDVLRAFKYTASSLTSSCVDISLFILLSNKVFRSLSYAGLKSTIVARICSGIINFNINQKWVFQEDKTRSRRLQYLTLFIGQMLASGILVQVFSSRGPNVAIIKVIVDSMLFFVGYFVQKNIIFSEK